MENAKEIKPVVSKVEVTQKIDIPGPLTLINESCAIYKKQFKTILGVLFTGVLFVGITVAVFIAGIFAAVFAFRETNILLILVAGLLTLVYLFSLSLLSVWIQLTLLYVATFHNNNMTVKEVYRQTLGKLLPQLWIQSLAGTIMLGGLFLFIIPGFIFMIWFSFASYILIAENIKGLDALIKSREYIRGYFFTIWWRFLIVTLAYILIGFLPTFLFSNGEDTPLSVNFLYTAFQVLMTPFSIIYAYVLYEKVKAARGDFTFQSSRAQRITYIGFGLVAFILPLILALLMWVFFIPLWQDIYQSFPAPTEYVGNTV